MTGQRREVRAEVTWPNIVQWKQQIRANKVQEKHRKHISPNSDWVFAAVASNSRWLETTGILRVLIWRQMVPSLEICDGATLCSKTAKIVQSRCTIQSWKHQKFKHCSGMDGLQLFQRVLYFPTRYSQEFAESHPVTQCSVPDQIKVWGVAWKQWKGASNHPLAARQAFSVPVCNN